MCGIYKITNKINGKVYIGQAIDINDRWQRHRRSHDNCAIHLAFNKYGIDNFTFEVIEECLPELLDEREIYWIDHFQSYGKGYNMNPGGKGGTPRKVKCFDENGNFIKEYDSIKEAALETNTDSAKISTVCSHTPQRYFAGDFQWRYSDDTTPVIPRKKQESHVVYQFDEQGELINIYPSIANAADSLNIDRSKICACCNGRQKTAYGFQWSYQNTCSPVKRKRVARKVTQYTIDGEFIATYPTLTAAANAVGGTVGGVGSVCQGNSRTYKGFVFEYAD